ncbi:MAG TPA: FHA domain-containing protein [Gammaproteobacteria bacterium]
MAANDEMNTGNETSTPLDGSDARIRELEKTNAQLRATIGELRAHIDGRRQHWSHLQKRLEQYQDTLAGLEQRLRDADDALARKDAEREMLSNRIVELERRLGSADEIRSLRQELVAQRHLIGKLESELEAKQARIDALEKLMEPQDPASQAAGMPVTERAPDEAEGGAENVEIIQIGELFRRDLQRHRGPIAVLEAPDGTTYPITRPGVTIGRASSNDICIRREFISRTHARVIVRGADVIIEDAGSTNGIYVNSEPVGRRLLVDGDIVSLAGRLDLKYVELDPATDAEAAGRRTEAER